MCQTGGPQELQIFLGLKFALPPIYYNIIKIMFTYTVLLKSGPIQGVCYHLAVMQSTVESNILFHNLNDAMHSDASILFDNSEIPFIKHDQSCLSLQICMDTLILAHFC